MDSDISTKFNNLLKKLEKSFGKKLDIPAILFLIGVNELGLIQKKFNKKEKMDLMHVAVCTLLEPYGHYNHLGRDADKWPHFELVKKMPPLKINEQEELLTIAILNYFSSRTSD